MVEGRKDAPRIMDFEDDAFVLSARPHGEAGAIAEILTASHGRFVAHVAGGGSRRMRPVLQPGARVIAQYRSRIAEQLGSVQLEAVGEGPSALFERRWRWLCRRPRRRWRPARPCRNASRMRAPSSLLRRWSACSADPEIWPAVYVRFEAGLLQELGFGLDPFALRRHWDHRRSHLRQPEERPRGQPRRGEALCRAPPAPAAVHAVRARAARAR